MSSGARGKGTAGGKAETPAGSEGFRTRVARELRSLLGTPGTYLLVALLLSVWAALFFYAQDFFAKGLSTLSGYFELAPWVLLVFAPALSALQWRNAREGRKQPREAPKPQEPAQQPQPLREVLGSFGAGMALLVLALSATATVLVVLGLGSFDGGRIGSSYLGVVLLGAAAYAFALWAAARPGRFPSRFFRAAAVVGLLFGLGHVSTLLGHGPLERVFRFLAPTKHYTSFTAGILDSAGLAVLLLYSVAPIALLWRSLLRRPRGSSNSAEEKEKSSSSRAQASRTRVATLLGVAAVIVLGANAAAFRGQIDLTETGRYSLSRYSKTVLSRLEQRVVVTYYVSKTLRDRSVRVERIIDVLRDYARAADGRLALEVRDASGMGSELRNLGLRPQRMSTGRARGPQTRQVYSGLLISAGEESVALSSVYDPGILEYRLTSRLRRFSGQAPRVAVFAGPAGSGGGGRGFDRLISQLQAVAEISEVTATGGQLGSGVEAALVLRGEELGAQAVGALRRYLDAGGVALIAADRVPVDVPAGLEARISRGAPIWGLLEDYGVRAEDALVADPRNHPLPVARMENDRRVQRWEAYPLWPLVTAERIAARHPIGAGLRELALMWASPLSTTGLPEGLRLTRLLRASDGAAVMEPPFVTAPDALSSWGGIKQDRSAAQDETAGQRDRAPTLALALASSASDSASAGPVTTGGGETSSSGPRKLVVVGDSDFASDLAGYTRGTDNLALAENAMHWLTGAEELLRLRAQAYPNRLLQDSPRALRQQGLAELLSIYIVPGLVLAGGLVVFLRRRRDGEQQRI